MEIESRVASTIRLVVMIGVGLVLGFGGLFWFGREMAAWLGFDERVQGAAGSGAVVLAVIGALILGLTKLFLAEGVPADQEEDREPAGPRHHRMSSEVEVGVWYDLCRQDENGVWHTTVPPKPFRGVVRTTTDARRWVQGDLPKNAVQWLVVDESKFESVVDSSLPGIGGSFLVEVEGGKRYVCQRGVVFWKSQDGAEDLFFDDARKVVQWQKLGEKKATTTATAT